VRDAYLMAATNRVSEAELESVLRTDPDYALELLALDYGESILRHIKKVTWNRLTPDELMVAYQETMVAVIERVRGGNFDPSRPLRLVYGIARHKGWDVLRARKHRMRTDEDAFLGALAGSLKDTEVGSKWNLLTNSERKEFMEIVRETVGTLPPRQKLVTQCFLDCYEDVFNERSFRPLAEEVRRVTGEPETAVNVKSTWHAAKAKIATELARRGFTFIQAENV
jgi:DNA-directed RNA polymerase specialized sigma24 family protein